MKTKKLLFGLIEMNGTMYNILYTVLCVVILLLILCGQAMFITHIFEPEKGAPGGLGHTFGTITSAFIMYFIGSKLMSKNNYT